MMRIFTEFAKKRLTDDELFRWLEERYLENIGLLDELFDLRWQV